MATLVTLAVLAGGAGVRMGTDKPATPIAGGTLLDHVLAAAGHLPTLVVGRAHPAHRWVADPPPLHRGPLAGLVAALAETGGPVVLVGADQPWLRPATVAALAGLGDSAVPVAPIDGGARQVLCALYPQSVLAAARQLLEAGRGLQAVLDRGCREVAAAEWRTWGEDGRSWFSIDTPAGLAAGLDRYGSPR
jgi:molybdopterin-guanine dinucleotide biosynthesis protein A